MFEKTIKDPKRRALIVAGVTILLGSAIWLEMEARFDGYGGFFDKREARASGIINAREWQLMQELGDAAAPSSGGAACTTPACRAAEALLGGRWRTGESCAIGSVYRVSDGGVEVTDVLSGEAKAFNTRKWRPVLATVPVSVRRDANDGTLSRIVEKRAGDLEVFTLSRSNYVRRIFRAIDKDTIMLVLVEQRRGNFGLPQVLIAEGRTTVGDAEVVYRRCPVG
jgi:hypothetical protein